MTLTVIPCLLYFAALFLTVATLWILSYATDPNEGSSPQDFFVLIIAVIPFVMLIYFGLAVIICDKISAARGWPPTLHPQLAEVLAVAVTYSGLTVWLWLRWRKLRTRQRGATRRGGSRR